MTPLLPLDFWRQEIGYSPWHFWGLATGSTGTAPITSKCNDVIREYGWQGTDEAGRADIREAIEIAEKLLWDNLMYWPAPKYSEKTLAWPRYQDQRLWRTRRVDVRGGWIPVLLEEGYVQNCGVETNDLIKAACTLTFTDEDGDGLKETFTVTEVTSVTDITEIALYFQQADRLDEDDALSARWRIEPLNIQIAAGTVTIKGKAWLAVLPEKYESASNYPLDPTLAANFITKADLYRRWTNTNGLVSSVDSQAALIWESRPCNWGCSNPANSSTDPASEGWVTARCGIRNSDQGLVIPADAVYNAATGTWSNPWDCFSSCSEPDRVLIRYLAGMKLDAHGHMFKPMRTLVSRLAAAEMTRRICACDQANREWSNWQFDVSRMNGPEQFQINLDVLNNPLGTRRGHIYAWNQIKSLARVVGMLS